MPRESLLKNQSTVLNLVLYGTGYHHLQKKGNLLTAFANAVETGPRQHLHVINGIGGVPHGSIEGTSDHPMLGAYDYTVEFDPESNEIKTEKSSKSFTPAAVAMITGKGFHNAMDEAVAVIEALLAQGNAPLIINFYGFSRGADTALRICNILYAKLENKLIEANIFSIDPVTGVGRKSSKKARVIPENIHDYHAILMANENTPGFEPQDKARMIVQNADKTHVTYQFLGGNHSTAIKFTDNPLEFPVAESKVDKVTDSPRLAWEEMQRFATAHGTRIRNVPYIQRNKDRSKKDPVYESIRLTDQERLAAYTRMVTNQKDFAATTPVSELINKREFTKNKNNYFIHGLNYFQDPVHLTLFQETYPAFFDYFFQENVDELKATAVLAEIKEMNNDPALVNSLKALDIHIEKMEEEIDLGSPSGIPVSLTDFMAVSPLWDRVLTVVNAVLTDLDTSVDKKTAESVRDEIFKILQWPNDPESKTELIHTRLEKIVNDCKHPDKLFYRKLATLSPQVQSTIQYQTRFEELVSRSSMSKFFSASMSRLNQRIAKLASNALSDLNDFGLGNDKETLTEVLHTAFIATRSLIVSDKSDKSLDKVLRICLAETSSFTSVTKSEDIKQLVASRIKKLKADLKELLPTPIPAQNSKPELK